MFPSNLAVSFRRTAVLALAGPASWLNAATITLPPLADTTLSQDNPNNNLGGEAFLSSGATDDAVVNRALLKFDISGNIPTNAIIQNVMLTIQVSSSTASSPSSFGLHRMLRAWGEGTKSNGVSGAGAGTGEATWLARLYPAALWTAQGGGPGDYVAVPTATQPVGAEGSYTFGSNLTLIATVQEWVTNSATNFGWMLLSEDEGSLGTSQRFDSREAATNGPKLTIDYIVTPRPHVAIVASADTSLLQYVPDYNLGTAALFCGGNGHSPPRARTLVQFSTEDIPPGAALTSATLALTVYEVLDDGTAHSSHFDLHRLLRPWKEGTKGTFDDTAYFGSPADAGETTWSALAFPTNFWSAPGGAAPVDFSAVVSSKVTVPDYGTYLFTNLVADVQFWVAHPDQNFGWMMICEEEDELYTGSRFSSREDPNRTNAPTLVVEYIPAPRIHRSEVSGNQFNLYFVTEAGLASVVQYRDSLSTGNWLTWTNLPALFVTKTNLISTPFAGPQRFYRVSVQ